MASFKAQVTSQVEKLWQERWPTYKLSQTYIWFPWPDRKLANRLLTYPRSIFSRMVAFITGHCRLRRHNLLVDPEVIPPVTCRLCSEAPERACHILMDCEPLWRLRMEHFSSPFLSHPLWHPQQMHGFLREPSIVQLEGPE